MYREKHREGWLHGGHRCDPLEHGARAIAKQGPHMRVLSDAANHLQRTHTSVQLSANNDEGTHSAGWAERCAATRSKFAE